MLRTLIKKARSDRGDSNLVSLIILIPLIIGILITIVDTSIYFSNRAQVLNEARDAARTVAIYGGDGTSVFSTPLEKAYGQPRSAVCNSELSSSPVTQDAYKPNDSSAVECAAMQSINQSGGLVQTRLAAVNCGPSKSTYIGERAYCEIQWKYDGVPGSALTFLRSASDFDSEPGLSGVQVVVGNAQSEVNLSGVNLQSRSS